MKPNAIHYKRELPLEITFSDPTDYLLDSSEVLYILEEYNPSNDYNEMEY